MSRSDQRGTAALGVAVGGVLIGHWLAYIAMAPDAHRRHEVLAATGHAYLGFANDVGLVLALVALAVLFLGRLTRSADREVLRYPGIAARLVAFQVGAFLAMEMLERVTAGVSPAGVFHGALLPTGIVIQIGVALVGALTVAWVLRVADRCVATLSSAAVARPVRLASVAVARHALLPTEVHALAVIRGPPERL